MLYEYRLRSLICLILAIDTYIKSFKSVLVVNFHEENNAICQIDT